MEILTKPHLPHKNVKSLICGNNEISNLLKNHGAEVISLSCDDRLPVAIKNHADIQCCHIGTGIIFTTNVRLAIDGYEVVLIKETPANYYPMDCLLNCFVINNILIAGKNCSMDILNFAERNSLQFKPVNQGYAKCSTAIISDDCVITADKTIANALENDCNVLVIESGHIRLDGYNYGFIGGACGKLSNDKLVFAGNPYKHPDGKRIVSFAEERNCEVISLCNGELIDFGGFIPLFEE